MPELIVSKADPVTKTGSMPDLHLHITAPLPEGFASLGELDAFYDEQAEQIEEALILSLPGGTYDQLLGRMLHRRACHFRVSLGDSNG